MKKLMAILLVCAFVLSMGACGKKENNATDTQPQNSGSSQTGSVTPDSGGKDNSTNATDGSAESTAPAQDPTEPSQDANKVEPSPETDKGEDIKVEIDKGGSSNTDSPVVTPSDDNNNNSFVFDFDDLLEASKK